MARIFARSLFFCAVAMFHLACAAANRVESSIADGPLETRTYEVLGMDCPGCHGGLIKLVKKLPAVKDVKANWEKQRMLVFLPPGSPLADEDIYDAIRRANFTPGRRITPNPSEN